MHQLLIFKSLNATAHMNNTYIYSIVNRVQVYLKIWNKKKNIVYLSNVSVSLS